MRRSRLVALITAILCVAVAASARQASEASADFELVRGRPGQQVRLEHGDVGVRTVRVGTQLAREGTVTDTTPGMFVLVTVTGAATGVEPLRLNEARLLADGGRVYGSYESIVALSAESGFEDRRDLVFEVDPAAITDLTLELWQREIVSGYQARLQVPLGITADNAEQWRAAAADQVLEPDVFGVTRGLP